MSYYIGRAFVAAYFCLFTGSPRMGRIPARSPYLIQQPTCEEQYAMFAHDQGQDAITDESGQARRLRQFSIWFLIAVFSVGFTTLLGYLATSILLLALISCIGLTLSATTVVTLRVLASGRVVAASTILFVTVQM